jgi:hypothetical protein
MFNYEHVKLLPQTAVSSESFYSMRKVQPTMATYPRWKHMGLGQLMLLMASRIGPGGKRLAGGITARLEQASKQAS